MIKQCVKFNLTVLGSLKYDYDIKTSEMLIFFTLKNDSVTIRLKFLLASKYAIIPSNTVNTFLYFI